MHDFIVPILALAIFATLGYFRGRKKNSWIAGWVSREAEEALKPSDTNYINIGGALGYNFTYKLKGNFHEASGTIVMLPRHSVLYFPISLLTTKFDRYYINLKADGKLAGEGHIVSQKYIRSARSLIKDFSSFKSEKYISNDQTFYILWRVEGLDKSLRQFLDRMESGKNLRHFCCHAENRNFFFLIKPVHNEIVKFLKSAVSGLGVFYVKGWNKND